MHRFSPTAGLLAAILVLGACSGGGHHAAAARPAGATATASATTTTTPLAPGSPPTSLATTTTTTSPKHAKAAAAAQASLDKYLAAVAANDGKTILATSEGAAGALGVIRALAADSASDAGATATSKLQNENFHPQVVAKGAVVLAGGVDLATDVRGPGGNQSSTSNITGPVNVALVHFTWRVKDFVYDGVPMSYEAEHAHNVQGPAQLNVALVLSYAKFTTAVVSLTPTTKGQHIAYALTSASLTTSAGTTTAIGSGFPKAAPPAGFIVFSRTDAVPTRLDASFRRPDGSTVTFTVPLTAQPS